MSTNLGSKVKRTLVLVTSNSLDCREGYMKKNRLSEAAFVSRSKKHRYIIIIHFKKEEGWVFFE